MKLTKKQLINLIKEQAEKELRLISLKKEKAALEEGLRRLDEGFGRESGYYAPGTEFDPNAPWNQREPEIVPCDVCDGTGVDPEDGEECYKCNGTGEIEDGNLEGNNDPDGFDDFDPRID